MRHGMILAAGLLLFAAACDDQTDPVDNEGAGYINEMDKSIEALERIEFDDGAVLEFFEPNPGTLSFSQWGPEDAALPVNKALLDEGLSPKELYERVTGREAPASIVSAQHRLDEAILKAPETPLSTVDVDQIEEHITYDGLAEATKNGDIATKHLGLLTRTQFRNTFCGTGADFTYRYFSATGDRSRTKYNVAVTIGGCYAVQGLSLCTCKDEGVVFAQRNIQGGTSDNYLGCGVWNSGSSQVALTNGAGDIYDFCFNGEYQ